MIDKKRAVKTIEIKSILALTVKLKYKSMGNFT